MNELYCMGRKERTHSRGQSPPQSSDQSPDGPGAAAGLANPALAEARIPAPGRLLGYSAPGAGEKIKDTEDIGLGDPGIQNSGAGAADSPQRRRLMGRCWNHGGDAHLDRAGFAILGSHGFLYWALGPLRPREQSTEPTLFQIEVLTRQRKP
uniref:39S ribosomal protein L14, mitochondrial isoform X1 n=1 Tax=Tursiops truncatus TaxID=9739 RepID=A0A6J3RZK4_TURTR|nr:39S ribosomal protein L14, mitochondrial isoform X1 [Globicephala melas]XP_033720052.1 39S ribosomal protein L14, mitochondrial isoform X1 [Tursiops truncatus]